MGNYGNSRQRPKILYIVLQRRCCANCTALVRNLTQHPVPSGVLCQHLVLFDAKFLLLPVKSHDNAVHTDEDGHRRASRPTKASQVSYRHPLSSNQRDPTRERADIPPGGMRSRTNPVMGRGRRIERWQQLDPPLSFQGLGWPKRQGIPGEGTVTGARAIGTQVQRFGDFQGGREGSRFHPGRIPPRH